MSNSEEKVLNPTVIKLGLVSLFADISSEMLYPITPIFLTTILGASMSSVGLIEGVAEGVASLFKALSGAWSDRTQNRKTFVATGYFLTALAKPLIGTAQVWPQVLAARSLDRFGKGIRTGARDALLSEAVVPRLRGAAFGWHRAMDTLGAATGPLLALWMLSASVNLRTIYFYALIPGLISVAIVFFVHEKRKAPGSASRPAPLRGQFRNLNPEFKKFLIGWTVFALTNSSDVFLILRSKQAGISTEQTILIYTFYNLVYAFSSPWLGSLSDKLGRKPVALGGLAVFAIVYLAFAVISQPWQFWLLFGFYGLYMGATDGVGKAWAVDLVDPEKKATGLGLLGMWTGFATIAASSVAGLLWDHLGAPATFAYGAAGALLAMVLLTSRATALKKSSRV